MRVTQAILEALTHGKEGGGIRDTQNAIEVADQNPAAEFVRDTQGAVEWGEHRALDVEYTAGCIEVAWPRLAPVTPPEPPVPPPDYVPQVLLICDLSRVRWFQDSRGYLSLFDEGSGVDRPLLGGDLAGDVWSVEGGE